MGYKRIEKSSNAEEIPIGKHAARIIDIGEKTIQVDETVWDASLGKKVATGNKVPKTFMECTFEITDVDSSSEPQITDLYSISWFTDNTTGVQSKLVRTTEKLDLLPAIGDEFEPSDAIGREVEVNVIHKEGWPRIEGPILRALPSKPRGSL